MSYLSSANASEKKDTRQRSLTANKARTKSSNEDAANFLPKDSQTQMLYQASSESHLNQHRPPLGPNLGKKGLSIFWGVGKQSMLSSGSKKQINRQLTESEQLLAQQ